MTIRHEQLRISWKIPVRLATTADHGLSGLASIDGVTPSAGDRILVWKNTTQSENGFYVAASGAWSRTKDFDGSAEDQVAAGLRVECQEGSTYGGTGFRLTTTGTVTIGTTSLAFENITSAPTSASLPTSYLYGLATAWSSNSSVEVNPGRCRDSTDTVDIVLSSTKTPDITASGANGLATDESETSNTWYYIYVISDDGTTTVDTLLSSSSTSPTLPSSYNYFRLVGAVRNVGSNFGKFKSRGTNQDKYIELQSNVKGTPMLVFSGSQASGSWTDRDLSAAIPAICEDVQIVAEIDSSWQLRIRPDGSSESNGTLATYYTNQVWLTGRIDAPGQIIETNVSLTSNISIGVQGYYLEL